MAKVVRATWGGKRKGAGRPTEKSTATKRALQTVMSALTAPPTPEERATLPAVAESGTPPAPRPKGSRQVFAELLQKLDPICIRRLAKIIDENKDDLVALEAIRLMWDHSHGRPVSADAPLDAMMSRRPYIPGIGPIKKGVLVIGGDEADYTKSLQELDDDSIDVEATGG